TPSISAGELDRLMRERADLVVLDSRPFEEYRRVSIPTATNVPGAELVLRVHDLAPSPDTLVVVNCAGRTRSIIGAQSLINAGVPNKVVALRNGTMGWHLAGLACDRGKAVRAPAPSAEGFARARAAAGLVDDADVRAVMTASWLRQMGWQDVFVLAEAGAERGPPPAPILGAGPPPDAQIACAELARLMKNDDATVIDLSLSPAYRKAHI